MWSADGRAAKTPTVAQEKKIYLNFWQTGDVAVGRDGHRLEVGKKVLW